MQATQATSPGFIRSKSKAARVLGGIGLLLLMGLVAVAVFAPWVAPYDPKALGESPYQPPSTAHWLGTNDVGQDIFSELVYGARISLAIGLLSALCAVGIGLLIGLLAGYFRGGVETVLMRVIDLTLAFPFLPLVIVLATFWGRGLVTTVLVLAIVLWARPARILRAQTLKVREFPHVVAARAMGAPSAYILARHVLPYLLPLATAQFVRVANIAVLIEAALAFLGLGDPNWESWGTMLFFANARNAILTNAWLWWVLPTGLALTCLVVGLAFLSVFVEEWADPRLSTGVMPFAEPLPTAQPIALGVAHPPVRHSAASGDAALLAQAALQVTDLHVSYALPAGEIRAVDGVSFEMQPRRIYGLVGESGCGKSTLCMALLRLLRKPARYLSGSVVMDDQDLCALPLLQLNALRGKKIAFIPQNAMNALNPSYSVQQQVAESCALTRDAAAARAHAHELLEVVGIPHERHHAYPHELSGGMRQRVVIAMALANTPAVLIADEPVSGLDTVTQVRVLNLFAQLRDRFGMAILLISHDLPVVGRVCDDLMVMYAGRLVETGLAREVIQHPRHPYTLALVHAFPALHDGERKSFAIAGEPPDFLHLPTGCRFQPRCVYAGAACVHAISTQTYGSNGSTRTVACVLQQELVA